MLADLIKVSDRVEFLLKNYPQTRDCDKILWLSYMNLFLKMREKMNIDKSNPYECFKEIFLHEDTPSMESIRRTRQKIQESGKFLGEKRKIKLNEEELVYDFMIRG